MNSVICLGICPIMQMSESMDVFFQDLFHDLWCDVSMNHVALPQNTKAGCG